MNKLIKSLLILSSIFMGCKNSVPIENLVFVNNKLYTSEGMTSFTGRGYSKFPSGTISNKITFINGVPDGEWVSYGYEGEVIQKGFYSPRFLKHDSVGFVKGVLRINICKIQEGSSATSCLFIITNKTPSKLSKGELRFKKLLASLKLNNVKIDEIKITNREW